MFSVWTKPQVCKKKHTVRPTGLRGILRPVSSTIDKIYTFLLPRYNNTRNRQLQNILGKNDKMHRTFAEHSCQAYYRAIYYLDMEW